MIQNQNKNFYVHWHSFTWTRDMGNYCLALTKEANIVTPSSAPSADEIIESGKAFQFLMVWGMNDPSCSGDLKSQWAMISASPNWGDMVICWGCIESSIGILGYHRYSECRMYEVNNKWENISKYLYLTVVGRSLVWSISFPVVPESWS